MLSHKGRRFYLLLLLRFITATLMLTSLTNPIMQEVFQLRMAT